MSKRYRELVADFETTPDPDDCRVWAWAIANISDNPTTTYGTELEDFLSDVSRFDANVWFHNLKFDGAFIMDWLLRNNYDHTEDRPRSGQFSTLISGMGDHYQIEVKWHTGHTTRFKDSHKKLPMSVANVAITFNLDELKGDIDHAKYRPPGYRPTADEWDYVRRDVEIMAQAMNQRLIDGRKLTTGSDALQDYKKVLGTKRFEKFFPILHEDMDKTVRLAYRGGYTYANPRFTEQQTGHGSVYDVNSLYPFVMNSKPLPYGYPDFFDAYPPHDGLYIVSITFTAQLRDGFLPMIQIKNSFRFSPTEYQTRITEPTTMVVTNIDLELMHEHYHLNILSYNGGLAFKYATGFFGEYIEKWSKIKEESTGGQREIAKLFLNSLYGKFATNPDITGKIPVLDEVTDTVQLVQGEPSTRDPVYTPMGVFITSWARDVMIRAAQANVEVFAYCDTDSLHVLTRDTPRGVEVHPKKLGAWDHEYDFTSAVFLRAKRYAERLTPGYAEKMGREVVVKIAGAPENITMSMTLDDMIVGKKFDGKLQPSRVPGGIVLTETTFTLQ